MSRVFSMSEHHLIIMKLRLCLILYCQNQDNFREEKEGIIDESEIPAPAATTSALAFVGRSGAEKIPSTLA